ncbi:MAG: DUF4102 domain-containing protein [Magnetococcales bacterium]|nr:DUF4102 domain-containing protein [Magnetococcales bacterium]MBF0439737.1 DUF4102 domain-containing protein [Magnetococcales bacterium]
MQLTNDSIKDIKASDRLIKLFDGGGMHLLITPAGGRYWRLNYRFDGKRKVIALGVYPTVSLEEARAKRDAAKTLLASGIDPSLQRKEVKANPVDFRLTLETDSGVLFHANGRTGFWGVNALVVVLKAFLSSSRIPKESMP